MIIAHSLDGCLRLREFKNGVTAVVELRNHLYPGEWRWCMWKSLPKEKAMETFLSQCQFHLRFKKCFEPVVQPGV